MKTYHIGLNKSTSILYCDLNASYNKQTQSL